MSNFWKRTLFGALFVIIMLGAALAGQYIFLALLALITVLGLWELYGLCEKDGIYPQRIAGVLLGLLLFTFVGLVATGVELATKVFTASFLFFFIIFFLELYRKKSRPFANIAMTLFGVVYIAVTLLLFYGVAFYPPKNAFIFPDYTYHPYNLLGYFFLVWSNDTGAYLSGSRFGRHKLFERISPGKTWEGSAGGAALCIAVALVISHYYTDISRTDWVIMALIIMVTGTLGDLTKSMFKRSINVKDSGNIIPGHGGIIDRFDALFLSAPFVFCYLFMIK